MAGGGGFKNRGEVWGHSAVVEAFPGMHKALSSVPNTVKRKRRRTERGGRGKEREVVVVVAAVMGTSTRLMAFQDHSCQSHGGSW